MQIPLLGDTWYHYIEYELINVIQQTNQNARNAITKVENFLLLTV